MFLQEGVQFEEYQIKKLDQPGEFGWAVLIRMERLIPFKDRILEEALTIQDVVRLGIHICRALEACARQGIVHRDIKPDNLFYSADTDIYKLGDFGIAHHLARPTEGKGRAGTLSYMSPEVYQGAQFTETADLYALGMILYRLLNHNRPPLLPPYPIPYTPMERDRALLDRLRGTEPKAPALAGEIQYGKKSCASIGVQIDSASLKKAVALGKIAQKQISADPKNRYPCAADLRAALEEISVMFP